MIRIDTGRSVSFCETDEVETARKCVKGDDFEGEKKLKTGEDEAGRYDFEGEKKLKTGGDEAGRYDFLILYYRILQVLYTVNDAGLTIIK